MNPLMIEEYFFPRNLPGENHAKIPNMRVKKSKVERITERNAFKNGNGICKPA